MDYQKILEIISLKLPSILLGVGIFVVFWIVIFSLAFIKNIFKYSDVEAAIFSNSQVVLVFSI